ncbi:pentapeptide repeat-containing protein [Paenibacillus polymyxa]|uniref:pentapeptide repeat-containing protein n=1 Tax=Paenibacillus polymyxa TaxID=1406 RepID=UPI00287F9FA0|nr:pentapeptide repeat-containing protein [Paenibacillus polymyxa]
MVATWTKSKLNDIKDTIPLISRLTIENLKDNFNENGQAMFNNLNGILGIAVKLLGRQLIDKYFDKISEDKLHNFGIGVYFTTACEQAEESLNSIESISLDLLTRKAIIERFEEILKEKQESIYNSNLILHFTPNKHPAVSIVRTVCESLLLEYINEPNKANIVDSFTKNFNENIGHKIVLAFGDDYEKHIGEVDEKWTKSKEGKILSDMLELNRIGFAEYEDLKYQQTYAYWNKVSEYRNSTENKTDIEEFEESLSPIDELIETFFNRGSDTIEKILFILADFGKGKSVYLKQKASTLARQYEQRGEGFIPIYFNLRDFDKYDQNSSFGVISDFLGKKYGVDVQDSDFQAKEYFYLIDSLDECGNLTEERIDKVITSIKKIQNINVKKCRHNRIAIASRPIEHGLLKHLNNNEPFIIKNGDNRPINHFISIYGFKKEQFNNSITDSLKKALPLDSESFSGISKKIIEGINNSQVINIHEEFTSINLLTYSELRRPIFSYMIYKLIINKADLSSSNKVGVYLSFINVLTKEAKYIDSLKEVNLKDEYKFRNILHATSALWMYETYRSNQGFLKKHDISNTIEGSIIDKTDTNKMTKYKDIENVEFLSQSYFGQKGDTFYFQHQSFAEILLAEYYLKLFIHYALDESSAPDDIRIRLLLGNPTEQTIDFFVGMLLLLKESVSENGINPSEIVIQRRKLLFPMLASLSTADFSKGLFSHYLKFKWFDNFPISSNTIEPPSELLENWIITIEVINKIVDLSRDIIESKSKYLLTTVNSHYTSLYNNEIIQINDEISHIPPDIDRWIAFLVGNCLYNNDKERRFFTSTIGDTKIVFDMLKNWHHFSETASPEWGKKLFRGLIMPKSNLEHENFPTFFFSHNLKYTLKGLNLRDMDFSFSNMSNISLEHCDLIRSSFANTKLSNVYFNSSSFSGASFKNADFKNVTISICTLWDVDLYGISIDKLSLELCEIAQGVLLPKPLSEILKSSINGLADFGGKSYIGNPFESKETITSIFKVLEPLIRVATNKKNLDYSEIKKWFIFEFKEDRDYFTKLLHRKIRIKDNSL